MAPQKGKQGTKGAKQIVEENAATLSFYRNMIFGASGVYFLLMTLTGNGFQFWDITFFLFAAAIFAGCIQFMKFMAKTQYTQGTNQLVDSGLDLNMESGVAEHAKDLIILTCACLALSSFTKYFWFLWLLVPLKGLYVGWSKVIAPWVFAPAPEPSANEEKKAKKMERRMRR